MNEWMNDKKHEGIRKMKFHFKKMKKEEKKREAVIT